MDRGSDNAAVDDKKPKKAGSNRQYGLLQPEYCSVTRPQQNGATGPPLLPPFSRYGSTVTRHMFTGSPCPGSVLGVPHVADVVGDEQCLVFRTTDAAPMSTTKLRIVNQRATSVKGTRDTRFGCRMRGNRAAGMRGHNQRSTRDAGVGSPRKKARMPGDGGKTQYERRSFQKQQ